MPCLKCEESRFGGSCLCGECARRQDAAIIKYLNGEGDGHSVLSAFGISGFRSPEKAAEILSALEDARSDLYNLRQPVDLQSEVLRLREEVWSAAEGLRRVS